MIPSSLSTFPVVRSVTSHTAHYHGKVTVFYPWHPLFGKELEVAHYQDNEKGLFIKCKMPDDTWVMMSQWMTDEQYCKSMKEVETPTLSILALENLSSLLKRLVSIREGFNDFACRNHSCQGGNCEQKNCNRLSTGTAAVGDALPMGECTQRYSGGDCRSPCRIDPGLGKDATSKQHTTGRPQ